MKSTIYHCDRCGREDATDDMKLQHVQIVLNGWVASKRAIPKQDWCRSCCYEMGLLTPETDESKHVQPTTPSFEDIVRAFVLDVIYEEGESTP